MSLNVFFSESFSINVNLAWELVYSKNYFNAAKIFLLRLFRMAANQTVLQAWIEKSIIKFLMAEKFKLHENYKRMYDVHRDAYFCQRHLYKWAKGASLWCNGWSDGLWKRVQNPVWLLHSLSGKYSWERYEPPYPPSYRLNSTITVLQGEWLWH